MRINFERSGGFVGMRITATIDTESLPADEAAELRQLVESAGFFDLPPTISSTTGADQFTYVLTVESESRQHRVEVKDGGVPPSLRPLLQRLTSLARRS
jgi:hypothetical protein